MFIFPASLYQPLFQYPTSSTTSFATQVNKFVGGKEQRYGLSALPTRRWVAKPTLVSDEVAGQLSTFFELVGGRAGLFQFTDPWTGDLIPFSCFEGDTLEREIFGEGRNAVSFVIAESREPL